MLHLIWLAQKNLQLIHSLPEIGKKDGPACTWRCCKLFWAERKIFKGSYSLTIFWVIPSLFSYSFVSYVGRLHKQNGKKPNGWGFMLHGLVGVWVMEIEILHVLAALESWLFQGFAWQESNCLIQILLLKMHILVFMDVLEHLFQLLYALHAGWCKFIDKFT